MWRRSKRRVRRDPSLWKGAWQASRKSGADDLQVLQDNLMERYPVQFQKAMRKAASKSRANGRPFYVVFAPTAERAYHKSGLGKERSRFERTRERFKRSPLHRGRSRYAGGEFRSKPLTEAERKGNHKFYKKRLYPFTVASNPYTFRQTAVVVWASDYASGGLKTHYIAAFRRALSPQEKAILITSWRRRERGATRGLTSGEFTEMITGLGQHQIRPEVLRRLSQRRLMTIQRGNPGYSPDYYTVSREGARVAKELSRKINVDTQDAIKKSW